MPSPPWTLDQPRAALQLGALQSTTDIGSLAAGLTKLSVDGTPLDGLLWQITGTSTKLLKKTIEAFIRGNDLVARYQEMEDHPFRSTVYWTAAPIDGGWATNDQLSLTISVETDLLDSHPEFTVSTQLPVEEVLCVQCPATGDPVVQEFEQNAKALSIEGTAIEETAIDGTARCLVLYRLPGGKMSLAEMVHPDDFRQLEVNRSEDGMVHASWRVFGQFLEKGVIRRARMNAVLLPRKDDVAAAAEAFQQFADSEAVLTT